MTSFDSSYVYDSAVVLIIGVFVNKNAIINAKMTRVEFFICLLYVLSVKSVIVSNVLFNKGRASNKIAVSAALSIMLARVFSPLSIQIAEIPRASISRPHTFKRVLKTSLGSLTK